MQSNVHKFNFEGNSHACTLLNICCPWFWCAVFLAILQDHFVLCAVNERVNVLDTLNEECGYF